ncbi:MAG: hypothetical protein H0X24_04655 [Ktedonobacterales bacterium]|nr:hypothetical protein [Ktedonobacterales bacterium]
MVHDKDARVLRGIKGRCIPSPPLRQTRWEDMLRAAATLNQGDLMGTHITLADIPKVTHTMRKGQRQRRTLVAPNRQ